MMTHKQKAIRFNGLPNTAPCACIFMHSISITIARIRPRALIIMNFVINLAWSPHRECFGEAETQAGCIEAELKWKI